VAFERNRSFAVIGLGTFGSTVATELSKFGNHVLGLDVDERRVARQADALAEAIIADGRDEDALREAGVGNYDVGVVAIGEDLEANILCTMTSSCSASTRSGSRPSAGHIIAFSPSSVPTVSFNPNMKSGSTSRRCSTTRSSGIT